MVYSQKQTEAQQVLIVRNLREREDWQYWKRQLKIKKK